MIKKLQEGKTLYFTTNEVMMSTIHGFNTSFNATKKGHEKVKQGPLHSKFNAKLENIKFRIL
jgi:hypothetical protein